MWVRLIINSCLHFGTHWSPVRFQNYGERFRADFFFCVLFCCFIFWFLILLSLSETEPGLTCFQSFTRNSNMVLVKLKPLNIRHLICLAVWEPSIDFHYVLCAVWTMRMGCNPKLGQKKQSSNTLISEFWFTKSLEAMAKCLGRPLRVTRHHVASFGLTISCGWGLVLLLALAQAHKVQNSHLRVCLWCRSKDFKKMWWWFVAVEKEQSDQIHMI